MDASGSNVAFVSMCQTKRHHMYEERILDHMLFLTLKKAVITHSQYLIFYFHQTRKNGLGKPNIPLQLPQHENLVRSFTTPAGNYLAQQCIVRGQLLKNM